MQWPPCGYCTMNSSVPQGLAAPKYQVSADAGFRGGLNLHTECYHYARPYRICGKPPPWSQRDADRKRPCLTQTIDNNLSGSGRVVPSSFLYDDRYEKQVVAVRAATKGAGHLAVYPAAARPRDVIAL